jgi:hypothetical protein
VVFIPVTGYVGIVERSIRHGIKGGIGIVVGTFTGPILSAGSKCQHSYATKKQKHFFHTYSILIV